MRHRDCAPTLLMSIAALVTIPFLISCARVEQHSDVLQTHSEPANLAGQDAFYSAPNGCEQTTIGIRLWLDESIQDTSERVATIHRAMALVRDVFARELSVRLMYSSVERSAIDMEGVPLGYLAASMESSSMPSAADITILFVGESTESESRVEDQGRHDPTGGACTFGRFAWVQVPDSDSEGKMTAVRVLHELGHIFGAWHSSTEESVMYSSAGPKAPLGFNRQALAVMKEFVSVRPRRAKDVTAAVRDRLRMIWREDHSSDAVPTLAGAFLREAYVAAGCKGDGDPTEAAHLYMSAVDAFHECGVETHPRLAMTLADLGQVQYVGRVGDSGVGVLSAAREMFAELEMDESPVGRSSMLLGWAYLRRGVPESAAASFRDALQLRVDRLGSTHWRVGEASEGAGVAFEQQGRYREAMSWLIGALVQYRVDREHSESAARRKAVEAAIVRVRAKMESEDRGE